MDCVDNLAGIKRVEFYIDGVYKANITSSPYKYVWDEFAIGYHELTVIEYDKAGNYLAKSWQVFAINLGGSESKNEKAQH